MSCKQYVLLLTQKFYLDIEPVILTSIFFKHQHSFPVACLSSKVERWCRDLLKKGKTYNKQTQTL